jgi:phage-related protein
MSNVLASEPKKQPGRRITLRAVYEEVSRLRERVEELNEAIARNKGKRLIPWDEAKKGLGLEV